MIALKEALQHIRHLVRGEWSPAIYPIEAGRFREIDDGGIEDQPDSALEEHPFEIALMSDVDAGVTIADQLTITTAMVVIKWGYLLGAAEGRSITQLGEEIAQDTYRLRRLLVNGSNLDAQNTGLTRVEYLGASVDWKAVPPRGVVVSMRLRLQLEDDLTTEA